MDTSLLQVAEACANLERQLRMRGATGTGLAALAISLHHELPPQLRDRLRQVARVRNQVVHTAEPLGEARLERFLRDVALCRAGLDDSARAAGAGPVKAAPVPAAPISLPEEAAPAQLMFSPPDGHPARLEADRRAQQLRRRAPAPALLLGLLLGVGAAAYYFH